MQTTPLKLKDRNIVAQSNSVLGAKYELTETEQKIILLAVAQIDSVKDDEFGTYTLTIPELEKKIGSQIKQAQLKETCRKLMQRVVYIENGDGDWTMFHWISRAKYFNGENRIEFKISDEMKPYLLQLKGNFTKIELEQALKFNSKYAVRFYQFCMQMQNQRVKSKAFNLAELYEILQLPKTLTTSFARFTKKVLDPSIDEINTKSDIKLAYEITGKFRKKITEITLNWDYKTRLQANTAKATEAKELAKYKGKEFLYFGALFKIEYLQINEEKNRIEAIFIDPRDDQKARADFDSLEHLDRAIREAKELKAEMKSNPEKYKKKDRNVSGLF